jgi:anti-sigma B factor antagonist
MRLTSRTRDGISILEPDGKLLIGIGDAVLRDAVEAELAAGRSRLILDLQKVTRIDSSGMAELVAAFSKVKDAGGVLKLLRLPPRVQSILGVTQLMSVFDVFEDEEEAVASFD